MKITKTAEEARLERLAYKKANLGCNICPCCGERKKSIDYIFEGQINKGISSTITIFDGKWVNLYFCFTCGAEWESEPY